MAKIKVRVTAFGVATVEMEDYVDQWHEKCDDDGDMEEGDDYPDIPEDFVIQMIKDNLEDGSEDLSDYIEGDLVEVVKV